MNARTVYFGGEFGGILIIGQRRDRVDLWAGTGGDARSAGGLIVMLKPSLRAPAPVRCRRAYGPKNFHLHPACQ